MRSIGIEEELLLVEAETMVPTAVAASVLRRETQTAPAEDRPEGALEAELQQQQIETNTTPCTDLADALNQVRSWRRYADQRARMDGARVVASGTSVLATQPQVSAKPRYQWMIDHFGLTTVEQLTCGCHVHVEVESDEEGVAVLDRIRGWLPVVVALSANYPFWQGTDSGYASCRSQAWSRFPSAGPSGLFGSAAAYRERVAAMIDSGVLLDPAMVYFDARLAERYPTV